MPSMSPFFDPGLNAGEGGLAVLQLKRDQHVPVTLRAPGQDADGYAEGPVTNTRFGSFPHSTLLGLPWGSQVLASKVDTGSRGRKGNKRKREEGEESSAPDGESKAAITAGTGFAHLLPPTPESWTISLPHRTQVVYTPDSSYILQRMRVAPGQTIIEAGAGSGSFTHMAARAVFKGHPGNTNGLPASRTKHGKVCSFEYHEPRADGLRKELEEHGLNDIVRVTHRDVYKDGFNLILEDGTTLSSRANAIFLDLPAPWLALRHLTRRALSQRMMKRATNPLSSETDGPSTLDDASTNPSEQAASDSLTSLPTHSPETYISPLDPDTPVHVCCFSPCIEQVQSTTAALRQLGWTEIEMVEIAHRRIDVRRDRVGLGEEGLRGVQPTAASVDEAVQRLREVEGRFKEWHEVGKKKGDDNAANSKTQRVNMSRSERLQKIKQDVQGRKLFKEGTVVHRTEPEVKTHTSYLTFAVLPREWTEEDEASCARMEWK